MLGLTAFLAVVWKFIVQLDKLYTDDFWLAVFGKEPLNDLGVSGLKMLVLYVIGAVIWWLTTLFLLQIGKVWGKRFGVES